MEGCLIMWERVAIALCLMEHNPYIEEAQTSSPVAKPPCEIDRRTYRPHQSMYECND